MNNLSLFNEIFTNGYKCGALVFIDAVCIILAISVIISKNPIVSVLFLIGLFLGIACHLLVSGVNFIGLSYLLVYVGAVSILFLFILMLINIRISELLNDTSNTIPLALIIGFLFIYPISQILPSSVSSLNTNNPYGNSETETEKTSFASSKLWDGNLAESTHIASIGDIMYSSYSIWLILTSITLLLAMVGAIVITIKQPQLSWALHANIPMSHTGADAGANINLQSSFIPAYPILGLLFLIINICNWIYSTVITLNPWFIDINIYYPRCNMVFKILLFLVLFLVLSFHIPYLAVVSCVSFAIHMYCKSSRNILVTYPFTSNLLNRANLVLLTCCLIVCLDIIDIRLNDFIDFSNSLFNCMGGGENSGSSGSGGGFQGGDNNPNGPQGPNDPFTGHNSNKGRNDDEVQEQSTASHRDQWRSEEEERQKNARIWGKYPTTSLLHVASPSDIPPSTSTGPESYLIYPLSTEAIEMLRRQLNNS